MKLNSVYECLNILTASQKWKLGFFVAILVVISLFDIIGVFLVGQTALLVTDPDSVSGVRFVTVLQNTKLNFGKQSNQQVLIYLSVLAGLCFIIKTFGSIVLLKKFLNVIKNFANETTKAYVISIFNQSIDSLTAIRREKSIFTMTRGVEAIFFGVIAPVVILVSDIFLVICILLVLFFVSPVTTVVLVLASLALTKFLFAPIFKSVKVKGKDFAASSLDVQEKMQDLFDFHREVRLTGSFKKLFDSAIFARMDATDSLKQLNFLPNFSKYIFEFVIVFFGIVFGLVEFFMSEGLGIFFVTSVFLASASRLTPTLLRIQQSFLQISSNSGIGRNTLTELSSMVLDPISPPYLLNAHSNSELNEPINCVNLKVVNLSLHLGNPPKEILNSISFELKSGEWLYIGGSSGAGKSSLVDALLGFHFDYSGTIQFNNLDSVTFSKNRFGSLAYVPQKVKLLNGTWRENLEITSMTPLRESDIYSVLKLVELDEIVMSCPNGIHEKLGHEGRQLSGGEVQRLGIARSLLNFPVFLVLDEATSALDSETELRILNRLRKRKNLSVVLISHRREIERLADKFIILKKGRIQFSGARK